MTDTQTFKLYGPTGDVIMTGSMNAIMERLPDTHARNDAEHSMLETAIKAAEAEERADEARSVAARYLSDAITRLVDRLDSFEKQRALSMKRQEAEQQRRDRQRVRSYIDTWPDPEEPEPEPKDDEGELEPHQPVDPEKYRPEQDDAEGDLPPEVMKTVPPSPGTTPLTSAAELGTPKDPKQTPQPISVSLW
jgi:hypothetical protein